MLVLSYPQSRSVDPHHSNPKQILFCDKLGYKVTNNPDDKWDCAMFIDFNGVNRPPKFLDKAINLYCNNIEKDYVDKVFTEVFGYSSLVTSKHKGYCVKKSVRQAAHNGRIIKPPFIKEKDFIYQLYINNRISKYYHRTIRIHVFGDVLPFMFIADYRAENMFKLKHPDKQREFIDYDFDDYFSKKELELIRKFIKKSGLDFGELDILRDNTNGQIYIIDINNIPGSRIYDRLENGEEILNLSCKLFDDLLHSHIR